MRLFRLLNKGMGNVHTAALALGAAGFLSRLLGVVRDRLLAGQFGAGRELDVYYAAFQIPDFISVIFLLGAGSAAILPVFQEYARRDSSKARDLLSRMSTLFMASAVVVSALAFVAAPLFARLIAPGFSATDSALLAVLMRIMLVSPILLGLSGIFSAALQSFERFLAYALAPIFYNLGIIAGILFFARWWGIAGLAVGVALGALLHMLIQLVSLASLGFTPHRAWGSWFNNDVKKITARALPRVISLSFVQLTTLVLIAFSSLLAAGSIAVFQFALNLYFVPVGIFGVSYSIAVFPRMTRAFLDGSRERFAEELFTGIRAILFWILPSAALFWVLRSDIVRVALGGSAFLSENMSLTAACLGVLTVGMIGASVLPHLIKSFYALERTGMPMIIDIAGGLASLALAFFFTNAVAHRTRIGTALISFLQVGHTAHPEVLGVALGFSLGLFINALLLYVALVRVSARAFSQKIVFPVSAVLKMVLAAVTAGITAQLVRFMFLGNVSSSSAAWVLTRGLAVGCVAMIAYGAVLIVARSEDMRFVRKMFMRV